jgi:hypothetical protein
MPDPFPGEERDADGNFNGSVFFFFDNIGFEITLIYTNSLG